MKTWALHFEHPCLAKNRRDCLGMFDPKLTTISIVLKPSLKALKTQKNIREEQTHAVSVSNVCGHF